MSGRSRALYKRGYLMRRIKWFLKQLLFLTYRSHYQEGKKKIFCVWDMWLGACFNIETFVIKEVM